MALFQAEMLKLSAPEPAAPAAATAPAASTVGSAPVLKPRAPPPGAVIGAAPTLGLAKQQQAPAASTIGSAPVRFEAAAAPPEQPAAAAPNVAPDLRNVMNAELGPQHHPPAPINNFRQDMREGMKNLPAGEQMGSLAQQMLGKRKKQTSGNRQAAGESWHDPTMEEWPQDDHRIFVGDLGNEVNDETLALAFKQYKSFVKAKVIREKWNHKTKGYGFVSFKDSGDMARALKEMNGRYIGNRPCKLRKSTWAERNASGGKTMGPNKKTKGNKHRNKQYKGTLTH